MGNSGRFQKGDKTNLGRVPTEEQRRKQSEAMTGRKLTKAHRQKIREGMVRAKAEGKQIGRATGDAPWNKGLHMDPIHLHTPEVARKISRALRGRKLTEEHKKACSLGMKGKRNSPATEFKKNCIPFMKGKKHKRSSRLKMSINGKGKHDHSEEAVKKMLKRRIPTSLESKFIEICSDNELPYKYVGDGSFIVGGKNPDFINMNGEKVAIEVYARYYKWRHTDNINEWKKERRKVFQEYGWKVLFFDETQVNERAVLRRLTT